MSHELVVQENRNLTAAEIKDQVNLIQQVMDAVMIKDVHYGRTPGCGDKPALYKPGAEKIATTFRFAVDPQVEDLSTAEHCRYRVRAVITHQVSGTYLGTGIGEASGMENKYAYRAADCQEEFDETPEVHRRKKWKNGKATLQVRMNTADVANTVLKMAKKRAMVDAVLTITAASDCFMQDTEDMDDATRDAVVGTDADKRADDKKKQDAVTEFISEPQAKRIFSIAMAAKWTKEEYHHCLKQAGFESDRQIPKEPKTVYDNLVAAFQKGPGR
jgi:hypothetical protein